MALFHRANCLGQWPRYHRRDITPASINHGFTGWFSDTYQGHITADGQCVMVKSYGGPKEEAAKVKL